MTTLESTEVSGSTTAVRRGAPPVIYFVVALLLLSHGALSLFGFFVLRQLDHRYTTLIDRSVKPLNSLHALSDAVVQSMAATNPQRFSEKNAAVNAAQVKAAQAAMSAKARACENIVRAKWLLSDPNVTAALAAVDRQFDQHATEVLNLYAAGRYGDAQDLRQTQLRATFYEYISAITSASDSLATEVDVASRHESQRSASASVVLLAWMAGSVVSVLMIGTGVVLAAAILSRR